MQETQIIYVQSEAQRAKAADDAIARHIALAPISTPINALYCCGVEPEYREGGAVLTSLTCPICKRNKGAWSHGSAPTVESWNNDIYTEHRRKMPMPMFHNGSEYFRLVPYLSFSSYWSLAKSNHWCYEGPRSLSFSWYGVKFGCYSGILSICNPYTKKVFTLEKMPASRSGISWGVGIQDSCMIDKWTDDIPESVSAVSIDATNSKWHYKLVEIVEG